MNVKVDRRIEPLVREAFAACVARQASRFNDALEAISGLGDEATVDALTLATSIDLYALLAIHEGTKPDAGQIDYLVTEVTRSEVWAKLPEGNARELLQALADNRTTALGAGDLTEAVFVVGAWLLSAFLPEGKEWADFLDEVLDAIESSAT